MNSNIYGKLLSVRYRCSLATTLFALIGFATVAATPVGATRIIDAQGDFLSTYTGDKDADLDVLWIDATRKADSSSVKLVAGLAGAIDTGDIDTAYVWGIDRGKSFEPFPGFPHPTGQGVKFDSYVIMRADGTGTFTDMVIGTTINLDKSLISIHGAEVDLTLSAALLGTVDKGFAFKDFQYNFWPRYTDGGVPVNPLDNTQISDFAPDARDVAASVPEPASWAMMLGGFGLLGGALRSRRKAAASFG